MYSPKVPEEMVEELYRLKQRIRKPMTVMVREAVGKYLEENKQGGEGLEGSKSRDRS